MHCDYISKIWNQSKNISFLNLANLEKTNFRLLSSVILFIRLYDHQIVLNIFLNATIIYFLQDRTR